MVDVASNYCQAVWVKSKQPSEIVEKIIENGYLFLGLWDILSDNGLEFQNEDMKKLCERFGIGS